jgi:hypothetical protein
LAQLWFPLKGHPKLIKIEREIYLKCTITDLEMPNKPSSIDFLVLGNYSCDSDFINLAPYQSDISSKKKYEMVFQIDSLVASKENMTHQEFLTKVVAQEVEIEETINHVEIGNPSPLMWTMYFDDSKSQEGSESGCILIDLKGKKNLLSFRLEFECINNTTEYESLVQGLKKAIDLDIKELNVFGDFEIIVRRVNNTIHCNSHHLLSYQ